MKNRFNASKVVSDYIRENKVCKASLGRSLGLSVKGVEGQTSTHAMRVDILAEMSALLKHNFFADLAAEFPKEFSDNVSDEKELIIDQLRSEVEMLNREKELLLGIIDKRLGG